MASFTIVLFKHKKNRKGEHPVYLRIADRSSTKYLSLKLSAKPRQWNENAGRLRQSCENTDLLNTILSIHSRVNLPRTLISSVLKAA